MRAARPPLSQLRSQLRSHRSLNDRLSRSTEVVAHMVKIEQVTALRAKPVFDLIRDPRRAIAARVNRGVSAKAGLGDTTKQLLPGSVGAALQGAAIDQVLAALGVR